MKNIFFSILILTITACAAPYQEKGLLGGFEETQISPTSYRVTFNGNGSTSVAQVEDFVLLRSAELAISRGYDYFVVINSNTDISTSAISTGVSGSGNANNFNLYGGQTTLINIPIATNVIMLVKEEQRDGVTYNARFIQRSIRAKYKMN